MFLDGIGPGRLDNHRSRRGLSSITRSVDRVLIHPVPFELDVETLTTQTQQVGGSSAVPARDVQCLFDIVLLEHADRLFFDRARAEGAFTDPPGQRGRSSAERSSLSRRGRRLRHPETGCRWRSARCPIAGCRELRPRFRRRARRELVRKGRTTPSRAIVASSTPAVQHTPAIDPTLPGSVASPRWSSAFERGSRRGSPSGSGHLGQ